MNSAGLIKKMIELNLIPIASKKQIIKNIHYIELLNMAILITLTLFIISILLILGQQYLSYKTNQTQQSSATSEQETQIQKINAQLDEVAMVQKNYIKWSRVVKNFLSLIPEDITLHALQLDQDNKKIIMSGFAETRQDFLNLKEQLENSDLLTDLNSPISNLLYQTDINFTLNATLNL